MAATDDCRLDDCGRYVQGRGAGAAVMFLVVGGEPLMGMPSRPSPELPPAPPGYIPPPDLDDEEWAVDARLAGEPMASDLTPVGPTMTWTRAIGLVLGLWLLVLGIAQLARMAAP